MKTIRRIGSFLRRIGYLIRASAWAALLGILETLGSKGGRRLLALGVLGAAGVAIALGHPVRTIAPGEVAIRTNQITGGTTELRQGVALIVPGLHDLKGYTLRDQLYRAERGAKADGAAPYQTVEGLSIGVEVMIRWALDPEQVSAVARRLPEDVGAELVQPVADGVLHRTFANHTVREIFSTKRVEIQDELSVDLARLLAPDGIRVKAVAIGNVDLPADYRRGLETMLAEELSSEKMRFTLELKEKRVKETALEADADKFKEKEIEQRRLEAEAAKVQRLKQAEAEAEARRIESAGEADSRRKLADSDAYRLEVTGKAQAGQLERESALIAKNPLMIQKTLADKLSDKIQVIVAPPQAGGFFAGGLLGMNATAARTTEAPHEKSDMPEGE
jgi:regulator of protease activity HflC (stomatin/prohibitin superfamily)